MGLSVYYIVFATKLVKRGGCERPASENRNSRGCNDDLLESPRSRKEANNALVDGVAATADELEKNDDIRVAN